MMRISALDDYTVFLGRMAMLSNARETRNVDLRGNADEQGSSCPPIFFLWLLSERWTDC